MDIAEKLFLRFAESVMSVNIDLVTASIEFTCSNTVIGFNSLSERESILRKMIPVRRRKWLHINLNP